MSALQNMLPLLGQVLLLAVLITLMLGQWIKNIRIRQGGIALLLLFGLLVPINGFSVAQWLRSVVGDLSVLTLLVFLNILMQRLFNFSLLGASSRKLLLVGVVIIGVVFYPLALGLTAYDPYQLGYSPILLSVLLISTSLLAWLRSHRDLAVILLLPLIAYNLHLLESTNLWEYLLDPVLLIYALVQTLVGFKFLQNKRNGSAT
jgi:hypothetical protein